MKRWIAALVALVCAFAPIHAGAASWPLVLTKGRWVAPLTPPVGGLTAPGTRFGSENNAYMFGNATAATASLGVTALGSTNSRNIILPAAHALVPATGDQYVVLFFRTPQGGASTSRSETILAVDGQGATGNPGGFVQWISTDMTTGGATTSTGQARSTTSGYIAIRRQAAASWQFWNQSVLGTATLAQLDPGVAYAMILGTIDGGSTDSGAMWIIRISDGAVITGDRINAPLTSTKANRPTSFSLWTVLGALNGATDRAGFGGSVSDYAVFKGNAGTFPTQAQAIAIAQGQVAISAVPAYIGGSTTLQYYNHLDMTQVSGTSLPADSAGANTTAATVVGTGVTADAPVRVASSVTLSPLGRYWVFPLAAGSTTGDIWFEGTAPVGATVQCKGNYTSGGSTPVGVAIADGSGNYVCKTTSTSSSSKPFTRYVQAANDDQNYIDENAVMDVGLVVNTFGQSEHFLQYSSNLSLGGSVPSNAATGGTGFSLPQPGSIAGPWASWVQKVNRTNVGDGQFAVKDLGVGVELMYGNGNPGDGIVATATEVISRTGYSVMMVPIGNSGTPIDAYVFDSKAFSKSITLSGSGVGPYTYTLALTAAEVQAAFSNANLALSPNFRLQFTPGTFSLVANGETITDTAIDDQHGTLSGTGGATGTIIYVDTTAGGATPASVSITFTGTPGATTGTLAWTSKSEIIDGSSTGKTTNINGYGAKQGAASVLSVGARYGFTAADWNWWTSNITDGGTSSTEALSVGGKITLMRAWTASYQRSGLGAGVSTSYPWIISTKARDTSNGANGVIGVNDRARQGAEFLWPETGNAAALSYAFPGAWYYDNTVDGTAGTPHQSWVAAGGIRIGTRQGRDIEAAYKQSRALNRGPSWGTPFLTTANTVCEIDATVYGTATAITAADPTALDEWYTGSSPVKVLNDATSTARIKSGGLAVELVKGSGTWTSAQCLAARYLIGAPGATNVAAAPANLVYDNRVVGNDLGLPAEPIF